jgi:ribosomal protein S13
MTLLSFFLKRAALGFCSVKRLQQKFGLSKNLKINLQNDKLGLLLDLEKLISGLEFQFIMFLEKKKVFFALLKDAKHAKGKRLIFNLPLNGQRTKTNAKTVRRLSKRKT